MTDYKKLKGIIDEIDVLIGKCVTDEDVEFKSWQLNAERFLIKRFGQDSWEHKKFQETVFDTIILVGIDDDDESDNALLSKINTGDIIFCYIAGVGFVGIGICTACEVPAVDFTVSDGNVEKNILDCDWANNTAKTAIDPTHEYFVGVRWVRTVSSDEGYWEKGMTSVPMVAYMMTDESTHNKVLKHFNVSLE